MTVKDNENTTTELTDEDYIKALREKPLQKYEKIDFTNALEGWVSPIEIFSKEIVRFNEGVDDKIQEVIELELGAKIDRDELIKAMNYDRDQYKKGYEKGYADGFNKAVEELLKKRFYKQNKLLKILWEKAIKT